jgi:hypothetical protein
MRVADCPGSPSPAAPFASAYPASKRLASSVARACANAPPASTSNASFTSALRRTALASGHLALKGGEGADEAEHVHLGAPGCTFDAKAEVARG